MENNICGLPDDLLVQILLLIPTKDAVATTILSKRWRYVWTMLPELEFKDEGSESLGWLIEKSLQLHKAPILKSLIVKLGPNCSVDVHVGKWVENAVNRCVQVLDLRLLWNAVPTSFHKSLYTCETLVDLTLSNEILVDVSSSARLPSLLYLNLIYVVYRDEDSLVRLLSSSPVLECLMVQRRESDNLKNFTVKVSSLQSFTYTSRWLKDADLFGLLVIDSPALTTLDILDVYDEYCLIENTPCLDVAYIGFVHNLDDKFLRPLSSVMYLQLIFTEPMVACCNAIKFCRLIELYFYPNISVDWLEPFMFLLHNSPKLETLTICTEESRVLPSSWNQPSLIPGCLSSHLEFFRMSYYGGREDEKQLVAYILANSKRLKTVEISFRGTCNREERQKEIESLPRISNSSRLLFPT